MFQLDKMREIAAASFTDQVAMHYGDPGSASLTRLLEALHEIHRWLAYEVLTDLVVFVPIAEALAHDPGPGHVDIPANQLAQYILTEGAVMPLPDGAYRVWATAMDPVPLAAECVVYRFAGEDFFIIDGEAKPVPNPTGWPSIFGLPTFVDLDLALEHYSGSLSKYSTCKILLDCWYSEHRVLLANKPERFMRRSLAQHLKSTLRDHEAIEVREEQIVDESHPVDIKVSWSLPHRIALIEVKWLGDSVNEQETGISATYRDARAKEGAKQLVDYLDANKPHAPTHVTLGYLVVFDGRRRGATSMDADANRSVADATHYRAKEITYDPEWHLTRHDFVKPSRFFLEPSANV